MSSRAAIMNRLAPSRPTRPSAPRPLLHSKRSRNTTLAACLVLLLAALTSAGALPGGRVTFRAPAPSGAAAAATSLAAGAGASVLPAAAEASVSQALAAAEPAYRPRVSSGRLTAVNPAQRLRALFTPSGLRVSSPRRALTLSLGAYGYGATLHPAPQAGPTLLADRVTYRRGAIQEWFLNSALGLEQGFTVAHRTSGGTALTLALTMSGDVHASLSRDGRSIRLASSSAGALSYGGLYAHDASGRALPSSLEVRGRAVLLHVDVAGARFPIAVDPLLTGEAGEVELEREDGQRGKQGEMVPGEEFGTAVALSGDGNTAIVGAPTGTGSTGAVWVFARDGAHWLQQGKKLTAPGGGKATEGSEPCKPPKSETGCAFGASVAISGNGDTALIGEPPAGAGTGAAWLFERGEDGTWTLVTQLNPATAHGALDFGTSVALSENGEVALVGAPDTAHESGEAWAFMRQQSTWSTEAHPIAVAGEQRQSGFGASVAISGEGAEALVGAPGESTGAGAAYVFNRTGSAWQQGQRLAVAGTEEQQLGAGVALAADGETALLGAPRAHERAGQALVFTRGSEGTWIQQAAFKGQADEELGAVVALNGDGDSALVGAPLAGDDTGAAWLYTRGESSWTTPEAALEDASERYKQARFGAAAALSSDGETLLIGAPHLVEHEGGAHEGGAWLFGSRPVITAMTPGFGPHGGGTEVTIEGENFTPKVEAVRFGQSAASSYEVVSPTKIVAYSPPGPEGEVEVTVETQAWLSAPTEEDRFHYTPKTTEHGGGGTGGKGKKNPEKPTQPPPPGPGPSAPLPTGKIVTGVLGTRTASPVCAVKLKGTAIPVSSAERAVVTLIARGTGKCAGRLILRAQVNSARRTRTEPIGSVYYSLLAGHSERVTVRLDAGGRSLLRARHGRLHATLLIARSLPMPPRNTIANVTLARVSARHA